MKMHRRKFLKIGTTTALFTLLPSGISASVKSPGPQASILQGATDENCTQFSIVYDSTVDLTIFAMSHQRQIFPAIQMEVIQRKAQPQRITKAYFSNLDSQESYQLFVLNTETEEILDQRNFKTLKSEGNSFEFAVGSCMDERYHDPLIWQSMVKQKPQVIFFIGDFCYADRGAPSSGADPDHLWKRFCETRLKLEIFFSKNLIPILAVWDDHDFGQENGNRTSYKFVQESQKNFLSFFAQDPQYCKNLVQGPGVSSAYSFKNQLVLLMDDRSFREPQGSKSPYAHWGEEQFQWMLELVKNHQGPTWFMNGSQVFPYLIGKESVAVNHAEQLAELLKNLKQVSSKFIFVSGDIHFSEISEIENAALGYKTFEITSSSVHSLGLIAADLLIPNRRRINSASNRNFIFVRAQARNLGAEIEVLCMDRGSRSLFSRGLSV